MKKLVVAAACVIAANANAEITIGTFASWQMSADQKSISIQARDVSNTGTTPVGAIGLTVLACGTLACPTAFIISQTGVLGAASLPGTFWTELGKANNPVTLPPKGLYYIGVAAYEVSNPTVYFTSVKDSSRTFEVVETPAPAPAEDSGGGGALDWVLGLTLGLFGFMRRFARRAMS